MTTVVLILMILVCFNFLLKQTFVTRNVLAITTLVLGIFAALMWQVAIEQSKTQIIDWLHDTALMRNIAAILSIDVVIQLTFCIFTVRSAGSRGNTLRSRIIAKGLLFYPGFIIFRIACTTHFPDSRSFFHACFHFIGRSNSLCRTAW